MVSVDAQVPLQWLEPLLLQTLATRRAHALLLSGPQGVGQFELAIAIAKAWLCETDDAGDAPGTADAARAAALHARPCGVCASCRLVQAHSHPDLMVLLPPALQEQLGWAGDDESSTERAKTKTPSKEIKVEAVRAAVKFAQTTSARGRAKVVVLHPAERMNSVSANTVLKTLEEPPGLTRFLLCCAAPDALLPTIRSRCQTVSMSLPPQDMATAWLAEHGVAQPGVLLAAAGGQPQAALDWARDGLDAALWMRLPALVEQGSSSAFGGWPLARLVDAMQKLCHDLACMAAGASPRYFPIAALRGGADPAALDGWMRELNRVARHADHPWNAGLLAESLVQQGQAAMTPIAGGGREQGASVHSRR